MITKEKIENFIIGPHHFCKEEESLKYKFLLLNSMLIVTASLLFIASIIRFFASNFTISFIDMSVGIFITLLYISIRKKKDNFHLVTNLMIGGLFIFFTVLVLGVEEKLKLIWYANLIVASFLLKGQRFGFKSYLVVSATLITIYITPLFHLDMSIVDILLAITSYSAIAIFMSFSEAQQEKNISYIRKSTKEIIKVQNQLYEQARVDFVTKLPNLTALREDIKSLKNNLSILVLDIDQYDILTNEFGEEFMEKIHKQVAKIFNSLADKNVKVYHIFGSRFALLIDEPRYEQDLIIAQKINSIFDKLKLESDETYISINFLIAIVRESENALSNANLTLRDIKQGVKKQKVIVYKRDKKREEQQKINIYWAKRIQELIRDDKIVVYFQPIVDNDSKKIVKYECLVRAIDGEDIISPYFFISVAKSKGVLTKITKIVIDKSFHTFSNSNYDFSINITDQDLNENYLATYLKKKTEEYNIEPNRVYLEVLENINSEDSDYANEQFQELRRLGFKLSIDDFGAESSNLSRLLTIKADIIKIDGQFIKNIDTNIDSVRVVETIVSLAKKMKAKTVAEFVHNEDIYHIVKNLGVDFSQGYYFSEPLPQIEKDREVVEAL